MKAPNRGTWQGMCRMRSMYYNSPQAHVFTTTEKIGDKVTVICSWCGTKAP